MAAVLASAIFGLWLLGTVIKALPAGERLLTGVGPLAGLLPSWNFFAPTPGVYDYAVLYRDRSEAQVLGAWREASSGQADVRPWRSAVWNPEKFARKARVDLAIEMARVVLEQPEEYVKLSIPYLLLLNHVSSLPSDLCTDERQFMIVRLSSVDDAFDPIFISSFHPVRR